jgi:hypothetical protein
MAARDDEQPAADAGSNLTPAYVRVLLLEALVIVILFWVGRHFA